MVHFEDFVDRFCSEPWVDLRSRPKLVSAIRTLCDRMPEEVYDELPTILILAPNPDDYGMVLLGTGSHLLVWLAPILESMSQEQNDFTLAHEFAHLALNHGTTPEWYLAQSSNANYLTQPSELGADSLAESWGYTVPEYRKR